MTFISKVKATFGNFKHRVENAKINTQNQLWWNNYARLISPDKIEVFEDYLKIDHTLVECIIVGLPQLSTDGYPNSLKPDFIEKLMNVSLHGCVISVSFGLVPIPTHEGQEMLQEAIFRNMVNQKSSQKNNPIGMGSIIQQLDARDIASTIESLHDNKEKMFHSSFIITIWAENERAMRMAKSHVKVVMNSHRVYGSFPSRKMLETFLTAQAFPKSEEFTHVEMVSSMAGLLCPTRNPNSSLANSSKGLYFGDDRKTGKEIVIDLKALPAQHAVMVGGSGSGKTFAMLMLLGRLYISGRNVVYLTVKPDFGTKYEDMASYFAPDSCIINLGPGGRNINPLQIMHSGVGLSSLEAAAIYDHHKTLINSFFRMWYESAFSPNMESYLDKSLNRVYKRAGIERDQPFTWKCTFPVFSDLIQVWEDDRKLHKEEDGESALALIRKTYPLGEDGSLSYMNRQTDIDLSKGFTVIDLVKVPDIIRPAMNVLVTGMLATYFKVDSGKGTTIAVDEGGAFLREKQLANMVLNILTQGRSYDIGMIFATQQFADLEKAKLSEEFMTNTPVKIVLGSELDKKSISYIKDFLMLDDTAVKDLKLSGKGQGIIKIGDAHASIAFIPSDEELKIIKGFYTGNAPTPLDTNQQQAPEGKLKDEYVLLAKENHILFSDWIEGDDPAYTLQMLGYKLYQPQNLLSRGFVNCWIHADIINEDGYIKNQTQDHYSTVVQMAGLLIDMGFNDVKINHFDDVDVSAELHGQTYGFEYEHPDSHDRPEIISKKERGLLKYKHILFIGSKANEALLKEAAGPDFVVRRGSQLKRWLDEQLARPMIGLPFELQENALKISEDLAIEDI
jgi:TraG P-loop domain